MLGNPSTIVMQQQGNTQPAVMPDGTRYTPDANGFVAAAPAHVGYLILSGFAIPSGQWANFRNVLDGGDFTINPWQRNVPALASTNTLTADIANTVTYFPDRWFAVGGASSAIKLSKSAQTDVVGFGTACKFQRKAANSNLADINFGQVCETVDSIRFAGRKVTLSWTAKAGANFSAAGGVMRARVFAGTGTDDTAANMVAGSWATSSTPIDDSTTVLTTGPQRFQVTGTIPAGTTQIGVLFSFTPVGTAGADDSIYFYGIQLEDGPQATPFEHRDVQVELEICQRYYWAIAEPAAAVVVGTGSLNSTTAAIIYLAAPVQFRAAPTVSVTAGTFHAAPAGAAASGTIAAGSTHTPNAITINVSSITGSTAGFGTPLVGGGGSGVIQASAEF